jgi:hypothetical protein
MFIRFSMMARLAAFVGIWLVTTGTVAFCSFQSGPGAGLGPGVPVTPGRDTFRATLLLRDVSGVVTDDFVFGEQIRFDLTIENRTDREMRVQFPDAQTHDFLVVDNGTQRIRWQWSDGQAFAQVATELVFAPNESKTFTVLWNGVLSDGTQLPPGNFQARGLMVYDGYETNPLAPSDFSSPLVPFRVR